MKFITRRNIKFVSILIILLSFICLSLSTSSNKKINNFTGKLKTNIDFNCIAKKEFREQEEFRDEMTRKLLFFVLLGYFYSVYL